MDRGLEILFIATSLLALGILFRRLRRAEDELERARAKADDPTEPLVLEGEKRSTVVSAMTAILAQCDLARGQPGPNSRLLQVIERHAHRVWDLLERHSQPVQPPLEPVRPIIPEDMARAAIEAEGSLADSRDVKIHLLVDDTPPVKASAAILANALQQVVRAAILSAPEGKGDVTVAVGPLPATGEPTHVGLCVADDGPGYESTRLLEILEPPPGGEAPVGTPERSYALAYALCRALGIGFVMDSAPGAGTRTTLKLPLLPAAAPADEPSPVAEREEIPHIAVPEDAVPDDGVFPHEALTEDLAPAQTPRADR